MVVLSLGDDYADFVDAGYSVRQTHYVMINALAKYLNGEGPRPLWIDQYHRVTEDVAIHSTLGSLTIRGPRVSTNRVTNGDSMTPEAKDKRARLMDGLMNIGVLQYRNP